jgi:hypothetical protein
LIKWQRVRDFSPAFLPQFERELIPAEGWYRCHRNEELRISPMRFKLAAATSILAFGLASAAFAQQQYSNDYSNDSDGFAPVQMAPKKPVHFVNRKAPEYSSDYNNDSDGFAPTRMSPSVDKMTTASIKPLPDCDYMKTNSRVHTAGGDSGASHTDACRDVGDK